MPSLTTLAVLALMLFAPASAEVHSRSAQTASKPEGAQVIGVRIAEGVHYAGEIWLRGVDGLVSLDLATGIVKTRFSRGVIDVEKVGNELWVLRSVAPDPLELTVSVFKQNGFEDLPRFPVSSRQPMVALFSHRGRPAVLSRWSVITFDESAYRWRTTLLSAELEHGVQISVASPRNGGPVFVGYNMGEFGGGIQALDLETGKVTDVTGAWTEYTEFDDDSYPNWLATVTSLIPHPEEHDCVLASTGLVHFLTRGGIWKICSPAVNLVYEASDIYDMSLVYEKRNKQDFAGSEIEMIEPFFGLMPAAHDAYWALGGSTVYRFEGKQSREHTLGDCRWVSGVCLSDAVPGVLIVMTDINWSVSVSGYTPLLVSLEE